MARKFKPRTPFTAAFKLLKPTYSEAYATPKKTYPDPASVTQVLFGSFKTYGGTEGWNNNIYTVIDTAKIETWYNPEISTDCRIYLCDTGEIWDVITRPEDIDMRHQFMQFRVRKTGGKP